MSAGATPKLTKSESEFELGAEARLPLEEPRDAPVDAVEHRGDDDRDHRRLDPLLVGEAYRGKPEAQRQQSNEVRRNHAKRHRFEQALARLVLVRRERRKQVAHAGEIRCGAGKRKPQSARRHSEAAKRNPGSCRHPRAWPEDPRLPALPSKDVDGRVKPGHDAGVAPARHWVRYWRAGSLALRSARTVSPAIAVCPGPTRTCAVSGR